MQKRLYVDMDGVLVDFQSGINRLDEETRKRYPNDEDIDEAPGIFSLMDPLEGAIESYELLATKFDTYILSTAPWGNPSAWSDKLLWVKKYLGEVAHKRLILSHNKHLCHGDFLIDDRPNHNGVDKFTGEVLHFGPKGKFKDWPSVLEYLLDKA
ncbi:MAG: hypothetical protein VCA36_05270 [Opitutales bacterium]